MEAGRVALSIVLATILSLSTLVAPASAQMNDDKQPSETNTKMYIFGNNDLTNCFCIFLSIVLQYLPKTNLDI